MWQFLLARAKEPSSYAGIAMLLTAAGIHFSQLQFNAVVNLLVAAAGAIAVFVPESKAAKSVGILAVVTAAGLVLAACSAASRDLAVASAAAGDLVTAVAAACREEPAIESLATDLVGAPNATLTALEAYANAVCANPAGPQADPSTAVWIGQIQGAIKALAAARVQG